MSVKKFLIIFLNVIKLSFKLNLWSTIYFNLKVLPLNQAIKFPFLFYGKTDFVNLSGNFEILAENIRFGMIIFGGKHEVVVSSNVPTRIYNSGIMQFYGDALFARGINLMIWNNGHLSFGSNFSLGTLSKIICFRKISFGNNVLISWECQFFDTDFHFVIESENKIKDNCKEVLIENDVWIGARSTILKNTFFSQNTIVGANSVCSGNYKEKYGDKVLIAGVPCKILKNDVSYLIDKNEEAKLFQHFEKNLNQEVIWKK